MQLRRQPLCELCREEDTTKEAEEVHHLLPLSQGGTHAFDNLQSLCSAHHRSISGKAHGFGSRTNFSPATVPTFVVAGPPAAGKSTYVHEHAVSESLIVDLDALFVAVSGLPMYSKPDALVPFVAEARDALINRLARPSRIPQAWIVVGWPDRERVQRMADQLGAELVVLDTPAPECIRRIRNDERRAHNWEQWAALVRDWWAEWERIR